MASNITMADVQKPDTLMNISTVASDYKNVYNKCLAFSARNDDLMKEVENLKLECDEQEGRVRGMADGLEEANDRIETLLDSREDLVELNKKLLDRNNELEAAAKNDAIGHQNAVLR